MKTHPFISILILAATLLYTGCAHQQTPTGGPDDKTGPAVKSTYPASEALLVSRDVRITVTFAEWLLPSSIKGITLFPATPIKAKVTGNRLEIKPLRRLNDSTTYHLVITSALKDLRNNPITKPLSIIFSTGPSLDSGKITGCIADPARKFLQPCVALFRTPWKPDDSGFCGPPDYFTQTDSTGLFSFEHVRTGAYRLIAFLDKNSDNRLQSGEDLYLPADSVVTIGALPTKPVLYPATFDTSRQAIATVKTIDTRTIIGEWKKPWDSLTCPAPPVVRLEMADTVKRRSFAVATRLFEGSTRFILLPEGTLDSIAYRLIYSYRSTLDTTAFVDTIRIDGAARPDTSGPGLIKTLPEKLLDLTTDLRLIWSEPVYPAAELTMADSLGDTLTISADTSVNDTTRYSIPRSLKPGRTYRIILLTSSGRDLSGNPLRARDSTDTASIIKLATLRADSIAVSLSGTLACLEKDSFRKWMFKPLSGGRTLINKDSANAFRFDSLASGKGVIGTFIDRNNNDRPDPGRLLPFQAPEPFVMFDDTVEARARWDVEGIELSPCDPCEKKKPSAADSTGITEKAPRKTGG
jgi:hypothetical protein